MIKIRSAIDGDPVREVTFSGNLRLTPVKTTSQRWIDETSRYDRRCLRMGPDSQLYAGTGRHLANHAVHHRGMD